MNARNERRSVDEACGLSRRELLRRAGNGMGLLALASLLKDEGLLAGEDPPIAANPPYPPLPRGGNNNPLAPHEPHFPGRAKSVIWVFMNGGPSQVDTFDYKPELEKRDGKALDGFDKNTGFFPAEVGGLMKSPFKFQRHGQCGACVSDLFPNIARHVDKMGFIYSCHTESNNHSPALFMLNTGQTRMGYPCVGSWVTYGLGSESQNLPGFVVMSDPLDRGLPKGHAQNWGAGFLPSVFQGTWLRPKGDPIDNLKRPDGMSEAEQRAQLDLLARLNQRSLESPPSQGGVRGGPAEQELAARIESFELGYRMQIAAPEALNLNSEPPHIQKLYGLDNPKCAHFAKQCLIARRLVERGVRFVQIYSGGMENERSWDGHKDIVGNHRGFAAETDVPVAGLLADLEQRGLLEQTLVVCGGEFGRLPIAQKSATPGRDHNPHAFTTWMAGGGIKGGSFHGETDEIGHKAVTDKVSVNDLHATILHLLGMDHTKLTFKYNGRRFRLTDVAGNPVMKIMA